MDRINLEREERRQETYHGEWIGADDSHVDQLSGFGTQLLYHPSCVTPMSFLTPLFFNLHTR